MISPWTGGAVSTSAIRAGGGDIHLQVNETLHLRNSFVSTESAGGQPQHSGGNIAAGHPELFVLDSANLWARAREGRGGNMQISADVLLRSPDSIIDASSEKSVDGEIRINALETDFSKDLFVLRESYLEVAGLAGKSCAMRQGGGESSLTVRDYEILPEAPYGLRPPVALPEKHVRQPSADELPAAAYRARGLAGHALGVLKQAFERAKALGDEARMVPVWVSMSDVHLRLGQLETAERLLDKALAAGRKTGDSWLQALVLFGTGNVYSVRKQYAKALAAFDKAAALLKNSGVLQSRIWLNMAWTVLSQAESEGVYPADRLTRALDKALALNAALEEPREKAMNSVVLGLLAEDVRRSPATRDKAKARALFQEGLQLAETHQDKRLLLFAYFHLGRMEEALRLIEETQAKDLLYLYYLRAGRLLRNAGKQQQALASYRNAAAGLKGLRPLLVRGYPGAESWPAFEMIYFEAADILLQQAGKESGEPRQQLLRRAQESIEDFKAAQLENYFRDECVTLLKSRQSALDRALPPKTAVLYPVVLPQRTELLLALPEGLVQFTQARPKKQLEKQVRDFLDGYDSRIGKRLHDWLIAPLESRLEGIDTLLIVPHGLLQGLPFAALYDGEQYLAERFASAVAPGLKLTAAKSLKRQNSKVLLGGLSEPPETLPSGFSGGALRGQFVPLPYVEQELKSIYALYNGPEPFWTLDKLVQTNG
ncbi:MAG: CHAT domain-containing protein, partial [Gammaproteobacteria bacterium]|nr:CHAT domain-containing protein [Gammaproteobacteria bacterium]